MTNTLPSLDTLEKIVNDTLSVIRSFKKINRMNGRSLDEFEKICEAIPAQIGSGFLKIAVVGVIKSGKSTFVNSLVGRELVRRGAGVMTSITTRIRRGRKNSAGIHFKTWDEINQQLKETLYLFPHDLESGTLSDRFDIRRKDDRKALRSVSEKLIHDFPVTDEGIRPEALLIRHAVNGFESCRDLVGADENVVRFESRAFSDHMAYTSDPDKAFYVKDVCLEVFGRAVGEGVEIADCQGADSPDPAQLDHILTYLESANLILYCISSRNGLRESDIKFLKRIENLGLLDNVLFINNCDLTEHDNLEDLQRIEANIRENLEFLNIRPRLFSFSCLYTLFSQLEPKISSKNRQRLSLWQEEAEMVRYCDENAAQFHSLFNTIIEQNRYTFMVSNYLKQVQRIVAHIRDQAGLSLSMLASGRSDEERAHQTLERISQNITRLETIVDNSIDSAVKGLTDDISAAIDDALARDSEDILNRLQSHIRSVAIDVDKFRQVPEGSGFRQILYLIFQEFKRDFDLYVIEKIRPQVKAFAGQQEKKIVAYFQSLSVSYQIDLLNSAHYSELETYTGKAPVTVEPVDILEIDTIKKILGLSLPLDVFQARYSPKIRANALADFSLHTLVRLVQSVINKHRKFSFSPSLKKAAAKIKTENLKQTRIQYTLFHRKLKEAYFEPLILAATRDFKEKMKERFNRYAACKTEFEHLMTLKHSEKEDQARKIEALEQTLDHINDVIETFPDFSLPAEQEKD